MGNKRVSKIMDIHTYIFQCERQHALFHGNIAFCSIFWWTNETVNIWSHIFGWMLFFGLTLYDLCLLNIHAPFSDKLIVSLLLLCFQVRKSIECKKKYFRCKTYIAKWINKIAFRYVWSFRPYITRFRVEAKRTIGASYPSICSVLLWACCRSICLVSIMPFGVTR